MSAFHAFPDASVRSPTYYVARTTALCPECGLATRLLALALPPHHETLDAEGSDGTGDGGGDVPEDWRRSDANAFLFYVEQLPEDVQRRLEQLSSHFRLAQSAATQNIYGPTTASTAGHCWATTSCTASQTAPLRPRARPPLRVSSSYK